MPLPPHEYVEHYSVALPPLNLCLFIDLLDLVDHLLETGLPEPLETLVRLVAESLVAVLALILVAYQLDQHHDSARLQQRLLVLRAVPQQVRQTQTRRLFRVETRALQLIQQNINASHLAY